MSTFPGKGPYITQLGVAEVDKVEPCPFCKADPGWLTVERGYIHCVKCGADGPEVRYDRRDGAIDTFYRAFPLWNRRP